MLEYFDAHVVGLTATPGKQTFGFFRQNLVSEYTYPQSVADRVNVDFDLYRTATDVREVLPTSGNPRSTMGAGLRSILTLLKARKVLFVNPIARIQTGSHERRDPLPAHADKIRESLLSPDPACAALTALATFHGLRAGELRNMHLTDLADGRLRLDKRSILLAEPVRVRLAAWLD